MPRLITLGLRDNVPPPEQNSVENQLPDDIQRPEPDSLEGQSDAGESKQPSPAWAILEHLGFDGLGEILFEPGGLVVLVFIALACGVIYFLVSGTVALLQEAFSSGGPPQGLGVGS
jgi:hypothetical protein